MWHSDHNKRKVTGGRRKSFRPRRSFEVGGYPAETRLGEAIRRVHNTRGNTKKIKLLVARYANVTDPLIGKTDKVIIQEVIESKANADYNRRKIIVRGAIIETSLGRAVVTSRSGQDGVINAVKLVEDEI